MLTAVVAISSSAIIEQKVVKLFDGDVGGLCIDDAASGGTVDKRLLVGVGVVCWQRLLDLGVDAISTCIEVCLLHFSVDAVFLVGPWWRWRGGLDYDLLLACLLFVYLLLAFEHGVSVLEGLRRRLLD